MTRDNRKTLRPTLADSPTASAAWGSLITHGSLAGSAHANSLHPLLSTSVTTLSSSQHAHKLNLTYLIENKGPGSLQIAAKMESSLSLNLTRLPNFSSAFASPAEKISGSFSGAPSFLPCEKRSEFSSQKHRTDDFFTTPLSSTRLLQCSASEEQA